MAQPLRSVEDEPDRLLARLRGPPPGFLSGHERGFDVVLAVLRRDLDLGQLLHVERLGLVVGW